MANANEIARLAGAKEALFAADPRDADVFFPHQTVVGESEPGYFVALANPTRAFKWECSYNLGGKRVGYLDRSDLYFIKALAYGHRQVMPTTVLVATTDVPKIEHMLKAGDLDVIITYVIPGSPLYRALQVQKVSLMGFQGLDINRIRMVYPYVEAVNPKDKKLKDIFVTTLGTRLMVMARENDAVLPTMRMPVVSLRRSPTSSRTAENFVGTVSLSADSLDPAFRCYGDPNIETKALCNSPYDVMGMPRRDNVKTVWDIPCHQDDDCPFYGSKHGRGGCKDGGLCEFPVGTKRTSFRKYSGDPFCYGCNDPMDPKCCDHSHDYVFPNDTASRKKDGEVTSIIRQLSI